MPNKLSDDKQRISASLPKDLVAEVKKKAAEEGLTFTDVLRSALSDFVSEYSANLKNSKNGKNKK